MALACAGDSGSGRLEATSQATLLTTNQPSSFRDAIVRVPPGEEYRADGFVYRASSVLPDDLEPPQVRATVAVTNETNQPRALRLKGCPVLLRAYPSASRAGTPAFFEAGNAGWECEQPGLTLTLAPGESRELSTSTDVYQVLGDANPEGRYYFSAVLRRDDHALELPAGDARLSWGLATLRQRAEASLVDDGAMVDVEVLVVNAGKRPVHVEYGSCALRLRVYRSASRSGEPVWDSSRRPDPDPRTGARAACPAFSAATTLAPGDSLAPREFGDAIPVAAILGDSLPAGHYYFAASVRMNGHFAREVAAGEGELGDSQRR